MGGDVLGDLGRVDVDVDELRGWGELAQLAGDPVVEAGADRDDQVGLVHRVVGRPGAVHAEHAEPLRVRRREATEAHQRAGDREVVGCGQLAQLLGRAGVDHAAARVEDGPLRVGEGLGGDSDLLDVALGVGLVAGQLRGADDRLVVDLQLREILRDVDEDRAGPAGLRDVEGLVDVVGDLRRVGDQERVLDDRQRDAGDVGLLKPVGADQVGADLAGDEDRRHRVHVGVGDRGDQVRSAGARGREGDADVPGGLCISLRRMAGALLVADLHVLEIGVVERVVERQARPARDPEYVLDTLGLESLAECVSSAHRNYLRIVAGCKGANAATDLG